jgi:hypothetical protein
MFTHLVNTLIVLANSAVLPGDSISSGEVRIELSSREVVTTIVGIDLPAEIHYRHEGADDHASFFWPADGWVTGYRVDVLDANGNILPIETLHHVGVVSLERRQLAYAKALRLFAAGRETGAVTLPGSMGVRMSAADPLVVYYKLVNETGRPLADVALRISFAWTPTEQKAEHVEILPLILNANPDLHGPSIFDLPAGISATTSEFTLPVGGRVRAMGGHLHDHAVEIRLEDVLTGKILVRLEAHLDEDGKLRAVDLARFALTRGGLRLEANRRYRVIAIYDNPTGQIIPGGAMAYLAGPFVPDDMTRWPTLDREDPIYANDRARLLGLTSEGWINDLRYDAAAEGSHAH